MLGKAVLVQIRWWNQLVSCLLINNIAVSFLRSWFDSYPPFLFLLKLESFFKVWLRESLHSLLWSSQTDSISLPSHAHNICSLGCHLPARCGYSGSFTVVSNQFVWFSQLDRKVFGSRPRLLWDSMTQWFVWGELLHADDPKGKTHQTVSQFHTVRI